MGDMAQKVQDKKSIVNTELKKSVFDWISAVIMMSIVLASLDVFGLIDISKENIIDFVMSWTPFFLGSMLLNMNMYKKGKFIGKRTTKFTGIISTYSDMIDNLSGEEINGLPTFCEKYNDDAIKKLQGPILKRQGISQKNFDEGTDNGIPALKTLTKSELETYGFSKLKIKAIQKASKVRVKGINVNILMSSMNIKDATDIGKSEIELSGRRMLISVTKYLVSTLLTSMLAVKDLRTWGWTGLILVIFKVLYMFAGSYMSYFQGYDDITINVANHILRKTDILKTYKEGTLGIKTNN